MDPSLCTQPPEITEHSLPAQRAHATNGEKKTRKSKLKSHRQQPPPPSPSADANYPVSSDQVAAALAASRARVARSSGRPTADEAAASASVDLVDLTGSSPPRPRGANSEARGKSAENSVVTPTPVAARGEIAVESLPPAPKLSSSTESVRTKRLKVRDDNFVSRASMEGMQAAQVAVEKRIKSSRVAETEEDGKSSKKARVSLDAEKTSGKGSAERVVSVEQSAQRLQATKTTKKASSAKKSKAASRVSLDAADNATSKDSESVKTNEPTQSTKPASKLSTAARVSLDGENKTTSNGSETVKAVEPTIQATKPASKASKAARVSLDGADKTTSKGSESIKAIEQSATSHKQKNNTISGTNPDKSSSPQTNSSPATVTKPPPKTKKRSFHDQILYTMLTTSRPYSIKSLAKACDTTTAALHHAMLSFLDKQLVISKEFPSKKGEPKKLYWANPLSLNELNGKSALCKEMGKLLAGPEEIGEAEKRHKQLQSELRGIMEELNPLLAVPTLKQMDEQILQEESELNKIQAEVQAIRARMESAAKPKPQRVVHGRFQKPSQPLDKPALKRKINRALSEYKERKRKCMDFVENLAEAMEKKAKDVASDKVLGLETDEAEWGCWVDEATGKVFGAAKKGKKSGGEEEGPAVKIPAKYMDV